jgi:hypothetical protein
VRIDQENEVDWRKHGGDEADVAPARTFLDYIDELGGLVVILLLILIGFFLLL